MCGIQAVFSRTIPPDLKKIIKASKSLAPRGPDYCKLDINHKSIFNFYRLCVNDTSDAGNQPFVSDNGKITLMVNGEIYNHKELENKFDIFCKSKSDCEVILRLYEKLRSFSTIINMLDGVYAIVLVDGDDCWFARDRIGVRPLYQGLTTISKNWAVASTAKALLPFCKSVKQVQPGICYYVRKGSYTPPTQMCDLWQNDMIVKQGDKETAIKELYLKVKQAVKKRLMSDRPIGCLLSGGLDSSIITALLCELIGPQNVRTYSIGMEGSLDLKYAQIVSKYLGTQHTEIKFTPEEGIKAIPEVIKCLESYDVTTIRASVGMYLISKYISENTEDIVIFSGEGSDELFCGYLYFHDAPSHIEAKQESIRLIKDLHKYDVLRADRTVSHHGLELRVPFLDIDVLHYSLTSEYKTPEKGYEKYILRKAFEDYLPDEIIWRRKNGFSDGCGTVSKPWYKYIQDFVEGKISDVYFKKSKAITKEALYYQLWFNKLFPEYNLKMEQWMPKWQPSSLKDPSGMLMKCFDEQDIL